MIHSFCLSKYHAFCAWLATFTETFWPNDKFTNFVLIKTKLKSLYLLRMELYNNKLASFRSTINFNFLVFELNLNRSRETASLTDCTMSCPRLFCTIISWGCPRPGLSVYFPATHALGVRHLELISCAIDVVMLCNWKWKIGLTFLLQRRSFKEKRQFLFESMARRLSKFHPRVFGK